MAETEDFLFEEEGFPWLLPLHDVLDETGSHPKDQLKYPGHHSNSYLFRPPVAAGAADPYHQSNLKSTPRLQRTRCPAPTNNNTGFGGPGMQAVFLDSGKTSCGTGVFLPRRAGTTRSHSPKKPACPPVLLPSRVVQALNLNVHEIGLQVKPHKEPVKQYRNVDFSFQKNKKKNDASAQYCSPEIFLPKEWTY